MAVFRIEKARDYTVMSNHHLWNTNLSLKAKGLLSLMLSLPENWDYTTKGLAHICKDGLDSICAGVRELEEQGYVIRERVRNSNGQLGAIEYRKEAAMSQTWNGTKKETPERRTYTVEDIAQILGIGRTSAYILVKEGHFKIVRIGNAIRVSKRSVDEWLDALDL